MQLSRAAILAIGASLLGLVAGPTAAEPAHPVLELRQYKIVHGKRDAMIALFDREFVESQEALGMRLIGQFRDLDDPDRFTWLREFPSMAARGEALAAFYGGPVWQAHRAEANPMLDDNDNVLLLRPAWEGSGVAAPTTPRPAPGASAADAKLVVATIYYLWKTPGEGFSEVFRRELSPVLARAGLPVLAAYTPEEAPNNFPRLPVRQGEKVFVWFTEASDPSAYEAARRRLARDPAWRDGLAARLDDFEERPAQVLRLAPTPRSRLR